MLDSEFPERSSPFNDLDPIEDSLTSVHKDVPQEVNR